jgi:uncharacterized protein (DUF58 family)
VALGGPAVPAGTDPRAVSTTDPKLVTRITPLGSGLLGAAAVLASAAAVLRYVELVALAGAALAALLLAAVTTARRPRLRATTRLRPGSAARGEPAALVVTIDNPSRRPSAPVRLEVGWVRTSRQPARAGTPGSAGTGPAAGVRAAAPAGPSASASASEPASEPDAGADADPDPDVDAGPDAGAHLDAALDEDSAAGLGDAGTIVVEVRRLRGAGRRELEIDLDTRRRGAVSFGPAVIRRGDAFGLVSSSVRRGSAEVLRVRPRAHPLAALPSAPARDPDGRTTDGAGGGVIFHGLREYISGEDLRFVHWPSSARAGVLMVRQHVEPSEPASTVVLDTRPDAYPPGAVGDDAFEEAVDVAASVVLSCTRASLGVVLLTTDGRRRAGRGRLSDTDAMLDELAEVTFDPTGTLDVLSTVRRGGVGTLVLVTGGFDGGALRAVAPVVHRFGRVVVVRVGPRSLAAARARSRRTRSDRPRLRRSVAPAGSAAALLGRLGRPSEIGSSVAGRLRVLDVPTAAELPQAWPAGVGRAAGIRPGARTGYFGGGTA